MRTTILEIKTVVDIKQHDNDTVLSNYQLIKFN